MEEKKRNSFNDKFDPMNAWVWVEARALESKRLSLEIKVATDVKSFEKLSAPSIPICLLDSNWEFGTLSLCVIILRDFFLSLSHFHPSQFQLETRAELSQFHLSVKWRKTKDKTMRDVQCKTDNLLKGSAGSSDEPQRVIPLVSTRGEIRKEK